MGWIRIGANTNSYHLHKTAGSVEEDTGEQDTPVTEHTKSAKNAQVRDREHPILSSRTAWADLPFISPDEITKRDGLEGRRLWIVVENTVLDCTTYIRKHPGGQQIIHGFGGQDCSWQWFTFHDRKTWNNVACKLRVGRTEGVENRHVKPKQFVGLRGFGYQEE